ncbi:MAG TPA: aminopeptidase, partial [Gammaproteobacteria bacterium]
VRRWLLAQGDAALLARRDTEVARRDAVVALLLELRASLEALYRQPLDPAAMRAAKAARLAGAQAEYAALRAGWAADAGYDAWMAAGLNNAKLGTVGLYHRLVPGFQALLAQQGGDLEAFHTAVAALAQQPEDRRHARLAALAAQWPASAGAHSD